MRGRVAALVMAMALMVGLLPASALAQEDATCEGKAATVTGSGTIVGTEGDDVIVGSAGDDTIFGLGGNDIICGGNGNDFLFGDSGFGPAQPTDGDDTI